MIKLIASDMDGTLLDGNGGISAYNVKMIKEAKEKGIYFVIASGRAYSDIAPVIESYHIKCACVTGNGAEYIDEEGKLISSAYLNYQDALEVIEILKQEQICFMIYTTLGTYSVEPVENVQNAFIERSVKTGKATYEEAYERISKKHSCFKMTEINDYKTFLKDVSIIKIEAFDYNVSKISRAKFKFEKMGTISYLSSFPDNVEITNLQATKGKILMQAIKSMNILPEEVMVIGDSYNDISMFELFENSVIMENAPDEVKTFGKYISKSNLEDGVGYAIKEWGIKC
ncbi:MAG: HAD family phosphatase [Erysipelotrichaceae bacterium]|nr:HAD family phosphatase [Erysipelotrichaceae bacterium]